MSALEPPEAAPAYGTSRASTRKNCALTYGYGPYANTRSWKRVTISRADGSQEDTDDNYYQYYAGPV
jgi:hypothetical protein